MSLYWKEAGVVVREASEEGLPSKDDVVVELSPDLLEDEFLMRLLRAFVLTRALDRSRPEEGGTTSGWVKPAADAGRTGGGESGEFERAFEKAWDEAGTAWEQERDQAWEELLLAGDDGGLPECSAQIQVFVCGCGHVTVSGEA